MRLGRIAGKLIRLRNWREGVPVKCPNCAAEVDKSLALCPHCGTKLKRHLSDSAAELLSRAHADSSIEELGVVHAAESVYAGLVGEADTPATPTNLPSLEPEVLKEPAIQQMAVDPQLGSDPASNLPSNTVPKPMAQNVPTPDAAPTPASVPAQAEADKNNPAPEVDKEVEEVLKDESVVVRPANEPEPTLVDEAVRPRSRQERKAQRARRRTMRIAQKRGVAQRGNPHLHTHDSDLAAQAAPVRSAIAVHEHRKMYNVLLRTMMGMLVFIGILFVGLFSWEAELWGGKTLPDVRGMSSSDATALLSDKGFSVSVTEVPTDDSRGLVLSESPSPGQRVSTSDAIVLGIGVSRKVPDVVGLDIEAAEAALNKVGLEHIEYVFNSPEDEKNLTPTWIVQTVEPAVGQEVSADTVIVLAVAPRGGQQ